MSTITSKGMILVHEGTGLPVKIGERVKTFRGEDCTVLGGTSPLHEGSSGRVYVEADEGWKQELYPTVFKMRWVRSDQARRKA
jgi:hypothetical protein